MAASAHSGEIHDGFARQRFLRRAAVASGRPALQLSAAAAARPRAHRWPGNVRDLRHGVESCAVLCAGREIALDHLPNFLEAPERVEAVRRVTSTATASKTKAERPS